MRLIDADALRAEMYHEAFETDTDLQKWDSGCWIRYRMFENAIDSAPTVDAVPVVRCKDCKWRHDDSNPQYLPCTDWYPPDNFSCAYGDKGEEGDGM